MSNAGGVPLALAAAVGISERVFGGRGAIRDKEIMGITHRLDNIRPSCVLPKQARERH